jgi:hypothetical protein
MGNRDTSDRRNMTEEQLNNVSRIDLFHPTLAEFVAGSIEEPILTLMAGSARISSLSMAIFCVRYLCLPVFSTEFNKVHRTEKRRIAHRNKMHPFYRYAATTWTRLAKDHWDNPDLRNCVNQLFDWEHSLNLSQWVAECAREWFPFDVGFQALSHAPLMELIRILNTTRGSRLQIAASLGLDRVCAALLDEGANPNEPSPFGMSLHCALVGPGALIGPWAHVLHEHARIDKAQDRRPQQRATVQLLLDRGGNCNLVSISKNDMVTLGTLALITCSKLMDAEVFFRIVGDHPEFGVPFQALFDRGVFLDVMNQTHPTKRKARLYLNALFEGLALRTVSRIGDDNGPGAVYDSLWRYTLANDLDWCDTVEQRRIPSISDEAFDEFVETVALPSLNAMRLITKDPRFDPNKIASDGSALLVKAVTEGLDMVQLLVKKGADLSVRNTRGLSIAHVSAQQGHNDILRWVVEQGADTGLVTGPGAEIPFGCNVSCLPSHCLGIFFNLLNYSSG